MPGLRGGVRTAPYGGQGPGLVLHGLPGHRVERLQEGRQEAPTPPHGPVGLRWPPSLAMTAGGPWGGLETPPVEGGTGGAG